MLKPAQNHPPTAGPGATSSPQLHSIRTSQLRSSCGRTTPSSSKSDASRGARDREVKSMRDMPSERPPKMKTREILGWLFWIFGWNPLDILGFCLVFWKMLGGKRWILLAFFVFRGADILCYLLGDGSSWFILMGKVQGGECDVCFRKMLGYGSYTSTHTDVRWTMSWGKMITGMIIQSIDWLKGRKADYYHQMKRFTANLLFNKSQLRRFTENSAWVTLLGWWRKWSHLQPNTFFFPTCQVRVVRFYVSSTPPSSPPPDLNCKR